MRGLSTLVMFQALLSVVSGILMANMSLVGKLGIWFLYRDYGVLRVWWKTALILFGVQLLLILILWAIKALTRPGVGRTVSLLLLLLGFVGAYFTYVDFTTTSHRLLKSDFHLGGYLVWVGWTVTCLYFLLVKKRENSHNPKVMEVGVPPDSGE